MQLYNKRWTWSIFSAYVVLMPILAVNIFTVFFAEMSLYVKIGMTPLLTEHLLIVVGTLLSSSQLHKVAHEAHTPFATIAACTGTTLDLKTSMKVCARLRFSSVD